MPPSPVPAPEPPRVARHLVAGRLVRSHVVGHETERPPLVLVPGLGALGYLLPTVRACAAWTRVHLLDLPGFGSRSTAHLPADLDTLATVLAAWLRAVPERPVLLAGHSTGAQVALLASLSVPDGVHALALAGATFPPSLRTLPALAGAVVRMGPHEQPGELPAVLPYYLRGARRLPQLLSSALTDRPEESVQQVTAPVHVLHGRHDGLCPPSWATRLADLAPAAPPTRCPGATTRRGRTRRRRRQRCGTPRERRRPRGSRRSSPPEKPSCVTCSTTTTASSRRPREANADDEHDPEGATIAFERKQLVALADQARATREALLRALALRDP